MTTSNIKIKADRTGDILQINVYEGDRLISQENTNLKLNNPLSTFPTSIYDILHGLIDVEIGN